MTTRTRAFLTALTIASAISLIACQSTPSKDEASDWQPDHLPGEDTSDIMLRKLDHTNALLHALALEQFPVMERDALALVRLSSESDWRAHASEAYTIFSARFREQAQQLADAAARRSLTECTLEYEALVQSCVQCHDYLRRAGERTDPPGSVSFIRNPRARQG